MSLTRRQEEVYRFLFNHRFDHPPTLDELCKAMGLKSRGSLHKLIQGLIDEGLVEPLNQKQRGIRVTNYHDAPPEEVELPFLGYIAGGKPIEAIENPEPVCLAAWTRSGRECYVLGVKGDSMMDDGILDGDWVVIERRDWAHDGEVVVALIDHSETTLKRIEQRVGKVTLHPANSAMAPMTYPPDRVTIQGVVIGLIRNYR
jgi:repressor LexA